MVTKNRKILVTGSNGFIGKNLVSLLSEKRINIITPSSRDFNLTKESDVDRLFDQYEFDSVVHLAADVGGIKMIRSNPGRIFYNNLMMNTLLMEKARIHGIKKFISLNTINSYPEKDTNFKEEQIWEGLPNKDVFSYGISKRIMLAQARTYKEQYDFDSINLIVDNTYGPHDNYDPINSRVIPALIYKFHKAIKNNENQVEVWGSGRSLRQFLFVGDLVQIIYQALIEDLGYNVMNVSNGETVTIRQIVEKISSIFDFNGEIIYTTSKPEGAAVRIMNNSKMISLLNVDKMHLIHEGLSKTIDWYLTNLDK